MRPHRLWISAFGSFPAEEEVDFDALAEAGLFLIHGPTGAGKTTVLDALCYALYGRVPGKRDSAKSLRCDHAPPGRGPSVALEVTIRGRRLKITRSPAWQRPKLRGTGTTRENEKALLQELTPSGEWTGLTTRVDEAGELIGTLLGMNAEQFFQVAMLPQGDFAKFLRADGEDRRRVLERLFSVRIYAAAESWLADRRTEAHREQQALRKEVDFAVKRLEEAAGPGLLASLAGAASPQPPGSAEAGAAGLFELPEGDAGPSAVAVSAEDDPLEWARTLEELAAEEVAGMSRGHGEGEEAVRQARARLAHGVALAERRRRHAEALTRSRALEESAEERADLETILAEAARADRVLPLIQAAEQRAEAAAKAHRLAADAVARALPLLRDGRDTTPDRLATLERDRHREITRLGELRAEESRLAKILQDREESGREITGLTAAQAGTDARLAVLPGLRRDVDARLTAARLDAARIPAAESAGEGAAARLRAAEHRDGLAAALAAARHDLAARLRALPALADGAGVPAVREGAEVRELLASWERERREESAGLEGLRADEARLAELAGLLAALDVELREAAGQESALREAQEALPAALADASARLAAVRAQAAGIPAAQAAADAAAAGLDAARRRDALRVELESARAAQTEATDHAQRLRDRHLDLRQARIDGMAAELALKLAPGEPCAVCGSPDHPAPAAPADAAPTAEDERAAQSAYDTATDRRRTAESAVAALASRLEEALAVAGELGADHAREALAEAGRELAALTAAAGTEAALSAEADRVAAELEGVKARAAETARLLAEGRTRRAGWLAERDRLAGRLDEARGADPTVQARRDRLTGEASLLAAALTAAVRTAELESGHREAAERTDLTLELAARELREAELALARLRESAGAEPALVAEADRIAAEQGELEERSREFAVTLAARRTDVDRLTAETERLTARIDGARGEDPTLAARLERLADEAELLKEAVEATREELTTATELAAARDRAEAAVAEAGFLGPDDARAAARPPAEQEEKAERLRELDKERAAVAAVLADPELIAAAAEDEPDLDALQRARDAADAAHAGLLSARHQAETRRARLAALRAELAECLERWLPAAGRHRLADRLAALTGGNSTDNQWNMRLSSYVLGERLRQVVESANERLDHMSGGRYLLEHHLSRSAGDRSKSGGGLGLRILDGWTGVDRDPATLSGGESFVTSLALALGLADVVTAEAGGVELGTLFVDEGFGTLDEDTLDGVLDILDGLRDGGRAVGIVSHVAELRTRVPAQLRVRKERHGSTLSTVT
ncbi:AAA family ATPase [Streptosporangium roseum]|uniref:Nuclease SbcCD subunit C n=1 Tax=Streptosporangium roseum (strain ATCC 12428 / DSM 43021 / JCM 3005 / KCTC 9067 / NCIMB 10171 / NRRL 2505 / NI 9100) TaxID=479432 RepID=D2B0F9_STRRD|nr:AAA family ATPase [Streptosporangium roseum]ACZ89165.1 exonuclease SbcC [Streptosporangium roseum DSM 43021]